MIPLGGQSCAAGQKGVCPKYSRKCYKSQGECLTFELGQSLGIDDTLCCMVQCVEYRRWSWWTQFASCMDRLTALQYDAEQ